MIHYNLKINIDNAKFYTIIGIIRKKQKLFYRRNYFIGGRK